MGTYLKDLDLDDFEEMDEPDPDPNRFILSEIKSPKDLTGLSYKELKQLAREIRAMIIATVSQNGGHLASSLGAVEIILALYRELCNDNDRIVFDVGHQALAHKLLTGRFDEFYTLRQHDGIAGFPRREESPYDVHDSGHASDSLSTAIGLLMAKEMSGDNGKVAAVIGDASISGGMSFEALNHIGQLGKNLIIVLNDNEMSISRNVGAISLYLGKIRLSRGYMKAKERLKHNATTLGDLGRETLAMGVVVKDSIKKLLIGGTLFEDMGITYIGPINGHDIREIEEAIDAAKRHDGPVLIHAVTIKGKGYKPAEKDPSKFHGVSGFDIATGELKKGRESSGFTNVFSKIMTVEGQRDDNLIAITAAMADGTGLYEFSQMFPDRFFDVGIAEEHAVTFASGLAIGGKLPVVAVYSTFMQRAFDQIVTNVALQNLHVVFCLDRAGIVGKDGSTHHGLFDIAYMRMIPNMNVLVPSSTEEMAGAVRTALYAVDGPVAVRYPRSSKTPYEATGNEPVWEYGKAVNRRSGSDVAILAVGRMVWKAMEAAQILSEQGIECAVWDMRWAKPIDSEVVQSSRTCKIIVTIEDGTIEGGFGAAVLEELGRHDVPETANLGHPPVFRMGFPDVFVQHGTEDELFSDFGLMPEQIANTISENLEIAESAGSEGSNQ